MAWDCIQPLGEVWANIVDIRKIARENMIIFFKNEKKMRGSGQDLWRAPHPLGNGMNNVRSYNVH